MTNQEYWDTVNSMQAGIDLDKLVTERVMGWKILKSIRSCSLGGFVYKKPKEKTAWPGAWRQHEGFAPSTNVRNAWEVLEAVKAKGNDIQITVTNNRFVRVIVEDDSHGPKHSVTATTFPEAMCKAALLDAEWRRK